MKLVDLKVKKIHPDAILPTYATAGSACFDLYAVEHGSVDDICDTTTILSTGIAFEIPQGWQMLIFSRSGHRFKNHVRLANCVGVIDSDYRGEVMVALTADIDGRLHVNKGDRIAQAQLAPVHRVSFSESDDLTATERGTGGFGSTGK